MTTDQDPRAAVLHHHERYAANQPENPGPDRPDPIHVFRARLRGRPGKARYGMARWSLVRRLARDARRLGDEVTDLGADAMAVARTAQHGQWGKGVIVWIGTADERAGRWLTWELPGIPREPVPTGEQR